MLELDVKLQKGIKYKANDKYIILSLLHGTRVERKEVTNFNYISSKQFYFIKNNLKPIFSTLLSDIFISWG